MSGIHSATKSIRPFRSSEEYLYAMKEDLAEWLKDLYGVEINVDTFLEVLETGSLLCHHANSVTQVAVEFLREYPSLAERMKLPRSGVTPHMWELRTQNVLMFETDDLVLRKNEKHFVLCLLEVARRASRFGMAAPVLIQLEEEIEEEIREELDLPPMKTPKHKPLRRMSDFKNLDQMVQYLVSRCTCPSQFPMVKVSEGKYRVGDSSTLIFVRILRNHVMVRVGGGWDTLEHYLDKHDPCRCTSLSHKQAMRFGSPQRPVTPVTPVHEIKAQLTPRQEGHGKPQSMLLLSRSQSPMPAVEWTPSAPSRGLRLPASSPDVNGHNTGFRTPGDTAPTRVTERSATPSRRQLFSEGQAGSLQTASTRTGRDKSRTPPSPGLGGSLPRPAQPASGPLLEAQRSRTPLGFQRAEPAPQQQQNKDSRLAQTWTKSQFLESKTKQTPNRNCVELPANYSSSPPTPSSNFHTVGGLTSGRPSTPNRCRSPTKQVLPKQEGKASPQTQISANTVRAITRSQSPTKQVTSKTVNHPQNRPSTPLGNPNIGSRDGRKTPVNDGNPSPRRGLSVPRQNALHSASLGSMIRINVTEPGDMGDVFQQGQAFERLNNNHNNNTNRAMNRDRETAGEMERECLFTPPPIGPEQESELYRSLEDEILSNMQILDIDSDENNNTEDAGSEIPLGQDSTIQELSLASRLSVLTSVPSAARSQRTSTFSVSSAEGSRTPQTEPSFDAVIAELSRGQLALNKVDVESWVAKIPPKPIGQVERGTAAFRETRSMDSGSLNVVQPNRMGSWSSLGSSVESKEPAEAGRPDHQDPITSGPLTKVKSMDTLDGSSTASSGSPGHKIGKTPKGVNSFARHCTGSRDKFWPAFKDSCMCNSRVTERSATPSRRQLFSEGQAGSLQTASTRTGRDKSRTPPSPGLGGSLPRPAQPASGPRLEAQRSRTPLGFQRAEPAPQQQQNKDSRLAQTWTPNRNSVELPVNNHSRPPTPSSNFHTMGGLTSGRPSTPNRCRSPTKQVLPKQEVKASPQTQISANTVRASSAITRSQSPTKQVTSKTVNHPQNRPSTPLGNPNIGSRDGRKTPVNDGNPSPRRGLSVPRQNALRSASLGSMIRINVTEPGDMGDVFQQGQAFERLNNNHNNNTNRAMNRDRETAGEMERECLFTPPPIGPEQESELYRSLEDEILSNMQILDIDSDENNNTEDAGSEIPLGQDSTIQELSLASRLSVLTSVPSAARSQRTSTFSVSSAEGSRTPQTEPSFDAVIAELSRGQLALNKVDVESWVAKIPPKPIGQVEPGTAAFRETRSMDSGSLNVAQPNRMGSWSSLGSSVESKEPAEAGRPDHQDPITSGPLTKVKSMDTLDGSSTASSGSPGPLVKARTPSFKQKRGLKKPERVPSIYKLKLRSKIRPRRDTRPEKKPSKIPTPVSYRHARRSGADGTSEEAQRKSSPRHPVQVLQGSQSSIPTLCSTEDDLGSEEDVWPRKQSVSPGAKISGRKEAFQARTGDGDEESWV
ncbi:UNVERIFIED_CONTAM: hypothetical protein FKN15_059305 [Acipenser sinensis]